MTESNALFLVGRDPLHPSAAGGDLQAWEWARRLASMGWTVRYVCLSAPGLPADDLLHGVRILRRGEGIVLAARGAAEYWRSRKHLDLVYEDPVGAKRVPYLSPLYSRAPVIAVWHQVSAQLLGSMRSPLVARGMAAAERLVARFYRGALLWAPSSESADEVSNELRLARNRIAVIPPTLADGIRTADAPSEVTAPLFLCLGVLRPYKNFDHPVRALAVVRTRVPEAQLIIAGRQGQDSNEAELRALVRQLGLDDAVRFHFNVSNDERQQLMRASTALVLPSLLEGFGIVSIEANAEGTPVIASSGVPAAAVADGVNGLRYAYGDIAALADRMLSLIEQDGCRSGLARGSLEHARALTAAAVGPKFDELVKASISRAATLSPDVTGVLVGGK